MIIFILRGVFVVLVTAVAMLYILGAQAGLQASVTKVVLMLVLTLGLSAVVIATDVMTPRKKLSALSGVFLGLVSGLLTAYALSFVIDLIGVVALPDVVAPAKDMTPDEVKRLTETQQHVLAMRQLLEGAKVFVGLVTCYIGISLVLQTKDDFRFVIPYVEFAKQVRGNRPTLLDTSVIIDGRILDIVATNILQGAVIVPRFVLNELQAVADSGDKLKRAKGRRGLDILQKLQGTKAIDVTIDESDPEGTGVDQKLVLVAQEMKARLMTTDFNLKKVAELRGVEVINLNDLTNALRPVVLPGERMRVRIQKPGEGPTQGVGYLEDGTMVVVENARNRVGDEIDISVTSHYQTSAGRMIFGQTENVSRPGDGDGAGSAPVSPGSAPSAAVAPTQQPQPPGAPPGDDAQRQARQANARNPRRNG